MLSVIIPTYNRSSLLDVCLASLVKQSNKPDEVIVVDNASSDNTKNVVLKYKTLLPLKYVFEKKKGIPFSRNTGVEKAKGDILAFIDDDCIADKNWVKNIKKYSKLGDYVLQGKSLNARPESVIASVMYFRTEEGVYLSLAESEISNSYFKGFPLLQDFLDTKNFSIKTKHIKGFDKVFDTIYSGYDCGEDTDLALRLTNKGIKTLYINELKVKHFYINKLTSYLKRSFLYGKSLFVVLIVLKRKNPERFKSASKAEGYFGKKIINKIFMDRKKLANDYRNQKKDEILNRFNTLRVFLFYILILLHNIFKQLGFINNWFKFKFLNFKKF